MSLLASQTIFSILFTLLIGVALYYYIRYKTRVLELTVREQAKVLQSVIMNMNSNNENIMNMVQNKTQEEVISDAVANDMNRFRQVNSNSNNQLIEVSDDSDSDSDSGSDNSSDSDSNSSSSSGGSDDESEHGEEPVEDVTNNGTRKIVFNGGNDCHVVEHLDGPDVKVIELTRPLYPTNENEDKNGHGNNDDNDDDDEDDEADDDEVDGADEDEDSDSESLPSDMDIQHDNHESHESHEIKENIVINDVTNQIQNHVESETISEVILEDNSLDNLSVKTVFKTKETKETKEAESHSDYNSMNVQSLRQLLKTKLSCEGTNMSEASINKLTKKELIKHLS